MQARATRGSITKKVAKQQLEVAAGSESSGRGKSPRQRRRSKPATTTAFLASPHPPVAAIAPDTAALQDFSTRSTRVICVKW